MGPDSPSSRHCELLVAGEVGQEDGAEARKSKTTASAECALAPTTTSKHSYAARRASSTSWRPALFSGCCTKQRGPWRSCTKQAGEARGYGWMGKRSHRWAAGLAAPGGARRQDLAGKGAARGVDPVGGSGIEYSSGRRPEGNQAGSAGLILEKLRVVNVKKPRRTRKLLV